jgi:predicted dithiol-disulfide oxidoreductase (DUF899 family)
MTYADTMAAMTAKRAQIAALHAEMRALQTQIEPERVQDYGLDGWDGPVQLSDLFAGKRDLILIHNMGVICTSCTMWADGFNGVYDHLASLASFVVGTPDAVDVQKRFAASRGWRFPMVSYGRSSLAQDLGYRWRGDDPFDRAHGGWEPGVSILRMEDGKILRLSDTEFGPGDGFCVVYSLLELLPEGHMNWSPSYKYG